MPKIPYNKRKDGRYYKQIIIGVDENGKRKVKTLYDRDWRALDKKVREFQLNLDAGKYIEKDITFGECAELWLKSKIYIREKTIRSYRYIISKFDISLFSSMKIQDIKPLHVSNLYKILYESGVKKSLHIIDSVLKSVFEYAEQNKLVADNITKNIVSPKTLKNKRRSFTLEEDRAIQLALNDIKNGLNDEDRAFVAIIYYTGMRRGEVLALNKEDIDFETCKIVVNKTIVEGERYQPIVQPFTKSNAGMREIPLVDKLSKILSDYLRGREDSRLFTTTKGRYIQSSLFDYRWKRILKKINSYMPEGMITNITPHYFRHNFATELAMGDIPIKTMQFILGHESAQMSMDIYADIGYKNKNNLMQINKIYNN